jgi:choline monooxygenase
VECVHPSTFRSIPAAEDCSTAFGQGWSVFRTVDRDAKLDWLDTLAHRMVGAKRNPEYTHLLVYPNITFGRMSLFSWVDEILPVSPTTSMVRTRGFCYGGKEGTLRARLMQRVLRNWAKTFFQALTDEDSRAVRAVQGGLSSRMLPSGGLLSVREERIFHFQRYVRDALQAAGPRPLRVAPSSGESNLSQSA